MKRVRKKSVTHTQRQSVRLHPADAYTNTLSIIIYDKFYSFKWNNIQVVHIVTEQTLQPHTLSSESKQVSEKFTQHKYV